MINNGWQLKTQALSEGGGCLNKHVVSIQRSNDDIAL
jgi:hypothetical protein